MTVSWAVEDPDFVPKGDSVFIEPNNLALNIPSLMLRHEGVGCPGNDCVVGSQQCQRWLGAFCDSVS